LHDRASSRSTNRPDPAKARDSAARAGAPPEALLTLQRSIGNAAVVQMVRGSAPASAQEQHRHGPGCGHAEDQQRPTVQRTAVHDVLRSSGRPLGDRDLTDMEARFGADFSDQREEQARPRSHQRHRELGRAPEGQGGGR